MNKLAKQSALLIGGGLIGSAVGCGLLELGLGHLTVIDAQLTTLEQWSEWLDKESKSAVLCSSLEDVTENCTFDWIIMAVPESATALWLTDLSEALDMRQLVLKPDGGIITLNSTQKHLAHVAKRLGLSPWHVPVHPIMGSEVRGFPTGGPMQVNGATAVVGWQEGVEKSHASKPIEQKTALLFQLLGFKVEWLNPTDHDMYYAVSSHLTHLFAVIQTGLMPQQSNALEPPSRAMNNRLAASDADLWADVLHSNRESLGLVLEAVLVLIKEAQIALMTENPKAIKEFWLKCQQRELLGLWREEIDGIDSQIADLLSSRLRWVKTIGRQKRMNQQPIVDDSRESAVYKSVQKRVSAEDQPAVTQIYQHIVAQSRAAQFRDSQSLEVLSHG